MELAKMVTTIIAIFGCITGILGLTLQFLSHRRDNYYLDFDFKIRNLRSSPEDDFLPVLTVSVFNRGKSPIQVKEINWLLRHCAVKFGTATYVHEQNDSDLRWKLFDGEQNGFIPLNHNDRKDFKIPFTNPVFHCNDNSYIEVVDTFDKRYEKPTGTWPGEILKNYLQTAKSGTAESPDE